jgi:oligopeptide transport system substrate-binding protein
MSKLIVPLLVLVGLVAAVVSLEDRRPRADFVLVHGSDFYTLDPQRMTYQHDLRMSKALFEPLATVGPDGDIEPAAAESWTVSDDGRTWTFRLRDELRFSNGDPLTSADFVAAWRRGLLPDIGGGYSSFFWAIRGGRSLADWRSDVLALRADPASRDDILANGNLSREEADGILAESGEATWQRTLRRFDETVGVTTPDDRTIVVELERPLPYFLDYVSFGTWSPVHRPTIDAATSIEPTTGRARTDPAWTKAGRLIGNGPFRLARWRFQRDCLVERNEYFWNADHVPLECIESVVIEDPNTAIMAFLSGDVDWIPDVTADQRSDLLEQRASYELHHAEAIAAGLAAGRDFDDVIAGLPAPNSTERRDIRSLAAFGTDYFQVNTRPKFANGRPNPLADPAVRRALALAIDKQAISDRVTRIGEHPSGSLVPAGSVSGYESAAGLGHDPDRARAELDAAGWVLDEGGVRRNPAGDAFPTIEILYSTGSPRFRGNSLALRDMWRRELGLPIEVRGRPGKDCSERIKRGDFAIARGSWFGDYSDPTTFLDMHRTGDSNNHRGYSNVAFDELMLQAADESDPASRFALLREAERIIVEQDLPVLPITTYRTIYMYKPDRVKGLTDHPRLEQHPARWRIDHDAAAGGEPTD